MVPVYATVSWLSYEYYQHSVYFEVLRDCYEAFAIASFFTLLCHYIAEDLHEQKNYFRTIKPRNWVWPVPWFQKCCGGKNGVWRTPRSGLTWFNVRFLSAGAPDTRLTYLAQVIWTGVFQYCFIRVFMTITAVVTQVLGRYCLESLNPVFAHIWVMGIEAVAVTIAMYCIIQFYVQVRKDIAQHSPLLKVLAIKLVIFLSFWQTIVISLLTGSGAIKPSPKFQTPDIKVGIPSFLLCIEMAFFAFFHLFAFSWRDYTNSSKVYQQEMTAGDVSSPQYQGGFLGWRAIADAANPWDMIKAVARAGRWLFVGHRKRMLDPSYAVSRTDTDETMGRDPTAYSNTKLNPLNGSTAYSGTKPGSRAGKTAGYNFEEDRQPLVHGQPGPFADGPPGRDHSPYSLAGTESREAADIGVATSQFEEYDDWQRGPPVQGQGPPAIHIRAPSGHEAGVVPYPEEQSQQNQPMPYFDPPPSNGRQPRR